MSLKHTLDALKKIPSSHLPVSVDGVGVQQIIDQWTKLCKDKGGRTTGQRKNRCGRNGGLKEMTPHSTHSTNPQFYNPRREIPQIREGKGELIYQFRDGRTIDGKTYAASIDMTAEPPVKIGTRDSGTETLKPRYVEAVLHLGSYKSAGHFTYVGYTIRIGGEPVASAEVQDWGSMYESSTTWSVTDGVLQRLRSYTQAHPNRGTIKLSLANDLSLDFRELSRDSELKPVRCELFDLIRRNLADGVRRCDLSPTNTSRRSESEVTPSAPRRRTTL